MALRPIGFLSDFGLVDEFAAVCHAVVRTVDSHIEVIDISHGIDPGDVRRGALVLKSFAAYSPPAVLLAVVDPGVGSERRAVAASAGDFHLVGPDNGLLMIAADSLGGVDEAVDISSSAVRLMPVSQTFHGRDIFSPVAAHLAAGAELLDLGESLDPQSLVRVNLLKPQISSDGITCHVLFADMYGNLTLNLGGDELGRSFLAGADEVMVDFSGGPSRIRVCGSFAEADEDEAVLFPDSSGSLALAVNRGSAAERFGLASDDEVKLAPMPV